MSQPRKHSDQQAATTLAPQPNLRKTEDEGQSHQEYGEEDLRQGRQEGHQQEEDRQEGRETV